MFLRKLSLLEKSNEPQREQDPAVDQGTYLATDLEYTDHALVTKEQNDGVMMDWETPIMKRSAELITKDTDGEGPIVLNVGFGMGIIDGKTRLQNCWSRREALLNLTACITTRFLNTTPILPSFSTL